MSYYKIVDDNGFVTISTVNDESGGNITSETYNQLLQMFTEASEGYGIKEINGSYEYAKLPEHELSSEELLEIILGGDAE